MHDFWTATLLISLYSFSTFVLAAQDTTASAMSRMLYLMCVHPEMQTRLRKEIRDAVEANGGDLQYDDLVSLPYLDAVCREDLRLCVTLLLRRLSNT